MQSIKYNYLFCRVDYPLDQGYRMEPKALPPWLHLTIRKQGDSKSLTVHSRIHVNRVVKVGPSYSVDFSDRDIIKDLSGEITYRFL